MIEYSPRRVRVWFKGPAGLGYGKEVGQVRLGKLGNRKIFDQLQLNFDHLQFRENDL